MNWQALSRITVGLVVALGLHATPARAQIRATHEIADPWAEAKDAYRVQDWEAARRLAAIASQRDPEEPRYYFALARILFQQGNFEDAVWFYDVFIELAQNQGVDFPGSYALERARAERSAANQQRANPERPAKEPEQQRRVREAFLERLTNGPVVSSEGGALATFQTLLQLGYADPDLARLRVLLQDAATREAHQLLYSNNGQLPVLGTTALETQLRRYEENARLLPAPRPFDGGGTLEPTPTRRLSESFEQSTASERLTTRGQLEYVLANYENAEARFREALAADGANAMAHQGLLNALFAQGKDKDPVLLAIARFEAAHPEHPALPTYKALAESVARAHRNAANLLYDQLRQP